MRKIKDAKDLNSGELIYFKGHAKATYMSDGVTVEDAIGSKVTEVSGKQLSTEDFTSLLKEKLESLSNYDDSAIVFAVGELRRDFDTLVSGDTTTAIKTFNEIIAFLEGISDTEDLASIIASIEQQIAAKQDTITDIATIREGASKGATALQEVPSGYAKTEDIPTNVSELENDKEYYTPIYEESKAFMIHIPEEKWIHVSSDLSLNEELFDNTNIYYQNNIVVNKYGGITSKAGIITGYRKQKINGATTEKAGFMSAADKTKLDGIDMTKKQDTLVSGMNIKTINGESILGEGNIVIEGGSGEGGDYLPLTGGTISGDLTVNGNLHATQVVTDSIRSHSYPSLLILDKEDFAYVGMSGKIINFIFTGNGTKFLSDDGTYKEVSSGSSSGGAYAEVNHGTSDTTFTLTPNTFHVWDEVASLDLSFGAETSGVANEYLFQFTSGATATTLTLPDDIKWANDTAPTIAENMIYQISVLKGLASVLEFSNAAELIIFYVSLAGSYQPFQCEPGMTWQDFVNSEYNNGDYILQISGGNIGWNSWYITDAAPSDVIVDGAKYTTYYS